MLEVTKYSSFAGRHSVRRETRTIPISVFCLPSNRFRLLGFSEDAMFQEQPTVHKPSPSLPHYLRNSLKASTANGEIQFSYTEQRLVCTSEDPLAQSWPASECLKFVHTRITMLSQLHARTRPCSLFKLSVRNISLRTTKDHLHYDQRPPSLLLLFLVFLLIRFSF
jgi:hypothetical protein